MTTPPKGLGKGLGALIPRTPLAAGEEGTAAAATGAAAIIEAPVADIIPNPRQPRSKLDGEALAELAASVKEHGLLQPLIVTRARPTDRAPYQLIAGERRWRAAQMAGLTTVPVILKEATPQQLLELALVENIQRADLGPLEEAEAFQALIDEFGLSQQQVADRVGKSRAAVANTVRLLRLPARAKALLAEGALTEGHARALLALPDDETVLRATDQVVARELTVRQTEELVRRLLATAQSVQPEVAPADEDPDAAYTQQLEAAFRGALGTKVTLSRGRRGGKLVIAFYSDEELQAIYDRIVG